MQFQDQNFKKTIWHQKNLKSIIEKQDIKLESTNLQSNISNISNIKTPHIAWNAGDIGWNAGDIGWNAGDIVWNPINLQSMLKAQMQINKLFLSDNFHISQNIKDTIYKLQDDIAEYYTSTCNVCGNKQSTSTHMNIEHISMKTTWGYESNHDGERHSLTLCCNCYDKHIIEGSLGKYVKVTNYM